VPLFGSTSSSPFTSSTSSEVRCDGAWVVASGLSLLRRYQRICRIWCKSCRT
jgi:hypothetical protein